MEYCCFNDRNITIASKTTCCFVLETSKTPVNWLNEFVHTNVVSINEQYELAPSLPPCKFWGEQKTTRSMKNIVNANRYYNARRSW